MDSKMKRNKRVKKYYTNKKAKVQYDEPKPEVFVLPPDILQKLGITLEKVDSNKKNHATDTAVPEISNVKATVAKEPQDSDAIRDVSLMKTAELMINSVFLSPTFAPVTTNTSELELLALNNKTIAPPLSCESVNNEIVKCSDKPPETELNDVQKPLSATSILGCPTNMTVSDVRPVEKMFPVNINAECVEVPTTKLSEELDSIRADDHLDEAYLSDCSSSNLEPGENVNNLSQTPINNKKITIISEEIITPYSVNYNKTRNCEISNFLSLACPVSRGCLISGSTSENQLPAIQNDFVNLSVKSIISPVSCYQSKITKVQKNTEESEIHNDRLSDCLDISVTDIEEHLKENEEVLQEFANDIISNESSDIINKIERSEKSSEDGYVKEQNNFIDRNTFSVSQYGSDQLFANGSDLSFYNNSSSDTPTQETFDDTISTESNGLISSITHKTVNDKISAILDCEETNVIVGKLDLDSKVENSVYVPPTQSINMVSVPQSNMPTCGISDTNKNNYLKNNAQNSTNNLQDKVEEISKYLKQCLCKVKTKSLIKANNTESYPRKLEQKDLKSNQGVEKPGGNIHTQQQRSTRKKPMKTYEKATKKHVPIATYPTNTSDPKHINPEMTLTLQINEINATTVSDTTLREQFCLCNDFGRMAFYDSDAPYKHIHFWEQRVANIEPELVFSVFNDDADCSIPNFDSCSLNLVNYQEDDNLEMELAKFNICWNAIESGYEICNVQESINNLEKIQQETLPVGQNIGQVSDKKHDKCEIDNPINEKCFTEDTDVNTESISTKIDTNMTTQCADNISDKKLERAIEESQIVVNSLSVDESNVIQCDIEKDTTPNHNEEVAEDEIIVIQIKEDLETTLAEKAENVSTVISFIEDETHSNKKDKTKGSKKCTQKLQRITFDEDTNHDQKSLGLIEDDPEKNPKSKNKKSKKKSEPTRKSARFTFEDEIEDDHIDLEQSPENDRSPKSEKKKSNKRRKSSIQITSDEEPLSIKKSRKQESLESSNTSRNNVEAAINNSETKINKVQCGVCSHVVNESDWYHHIGKEHSYVAWKLGEPAVDMNDEEEFETHLKEIVKQTACLVCSKCGLTRKYVKPYLKHFRQCDGDQNVTIKLENVSLDHNADISTTNEIENECELIKCGVCQEEVDPQNWTKHIQMKHDYLAWRQGETLDLDNPDAVHDHLVSILKNEGHLICSKCGLRRKKIKVYLDHMKVCKADHTETAENEDHISTTANEEAVICDVCKKEVVLKKWNVHNMKEHYNLAWIKGEPPVLATALNIIEKLLKEYKNKYKHLVCNVCGISRVSYMGFYAHIIVCGKSEEEIEKFMMLCNICNKKYIFLYQSQHAAIHREQERAKERKMQAEIMKTTKSAEQDAQETPSGRRKAAEKARTVIEKYNENTTATYKCDECSFSSDIKKEFKKHNCGTGVADSDAELSATSESEESYDDVDSNLSDDEENISSKKGSKDISKSPVAKLKLLPFIATKPKQYIARSGEEFYRTYLASEGLFPEWRNLVCEGVSQQDMPSYMPPLKESCKVRISSEKQDDEWETYKRFEAVKHKDATALFVGASIQCAAWAPSRAHDGADAREESAFLAVSVHRGADSPRFSANETYSHPALIQIWDFGNFKSLPQFVFGLVHEYGTVWSVDWCPSGARDAPGGDAPRLGLLAAACSDGVVHIYSVPYPPASEDSENLFYRLKPVAELKISSTSNRKLYQATAVRWCKQIGHAVIFVGYSDGTTAFYDLNTESPLLRATENGVTVLYPYYDERAHISCVTDVSTFPCGARAGATISGAATGVRVTSSPAARARPRRRGTHHAATTAGFEPLFPRAIFTTDCATVMASPPELEWAGAGQRVGSLGALAGCARCGLCLAFAAPYLCAMRPHPAYLELHKRCIGTLDTILLSKKRKKPLKDDNLATIVEPITYEDAIKKYGVELRIDKDIKMINSRQRDMHAERFPLCDPAAMAFCPAPAHHDRVAIATHSGVIFVVVVSNRV